MLVARATSIIRPRPRFIGAAYSQIMWERRRELPRPRHYVTLWKPEDYVAELNLRDEDARRFIAALGYGDPIAMRVFALARRSRYERRRSTTLSPYTDTYTSGSGTITAPSLVATAAIKSQAGGGGGDIATTAANTRGGGGGGYCADNPFAVSAGDQLGYVVGGGGAGASPAGSAGNGLGGSNTTTSSGTGGFAGRAHAAGGGGGATTAANGAAGTASGGATTNTAGVAGSSGSSGSGGDSVSGTGGANSDGVTGGSDGSGYGSGGGGGRTADGFVGGSGSGGRFQVDWA